MKQIEKHEKAIKILELIDQVDYKIYSHKKDLNNNNRVIKDWALDRYVLNLKIKEKLENYYNKNFKI